MIRLITGCLGCGMMLFAGAAHAAKSADFQKFGTNISGNVATIGTTGGATLYSQAGLAARPGNMSGWTPAGNYGAATSATGPTMTMSMGGNVFLAGTKYPFQAAYVAPVSVLVDAVVALKGGPLGVAVFAAPLILDWYSKSGGRLNPDTGAMERLDTSVCSVAPCNVYAVNLYGQMSNPIASGYKSSKALACEAARASWESVVPVSQKPIGVQINASSCTVFSSLAGWTKLADHALTSGTVNPSPANWLPSSMDDIAPYMKNTQPDAGVVQQILDKGGDINLPNPTITGPSSVVGSPTVTNNPDGTKTTTSTTSNFTNSGNTITNTSNVTTVTINNADNSVKSVSTTTAAPTPPTDDAQANDTPLTDQPTLYKRKYPDGLTGVWNAQKAALLATPLIAMTSNLQPTIAAPSGYPTWPIPVVVGKWNYGTYDVSPAPYVWDFLKVCTILGALFLCRALIFGG